MEKKANSETLEEQTIKKTEDNREWIAWRKAKRDGRLTEHRRMLKSSAYRKMKKSEANQKDKEREREG